MKDFMSAVERVKSEVDYYFVLGLFVIRGSDFLNYFLFILFCFIFW